MVSFLKKKRPQSGIHNSQGQAQGDGIALKRSSTATGQGGVGGLRHSLSLPDLITPLLDPSSWEEVPPFAFPIDSNSNSNSLPSGGGGGRDRKPSLVGGVQFHKPFTSPISIHGGPTSLDKGNFRISSARWIREERDKGLRDSHVSAIAAAGPRRKGRGRKKGTASRFNLLIAGGKGSGKTSFINLLAASLSHPLRTESSTPFHPTSNFMTSPKPTARPIVQTVLATLLSSDRLLVRLIDTPGLELDPIDHVKVKERERGVLGLLRIVEERFEETLREESKVRRQVGADDGWVHLIIYLIDAREVLHPRIKQDTQVDWSCVGLFDDENHLQLNDHDRPMDPTAEDDTRKPTLSAVDIDIILRLSKRANVLPILSHSDALTIAELKSVRQAVRCDLDQALVNVQDVGDSGFGLFESDDEEGKIPNIVEEGRDIPTNLPYCIFSPPIIPLLTMAKDETSEIQSPEYTRRYPWGEASVISPQHSDFLALRQKILVDKVQWMRDKTRDVLYERYRTERLMAKNNRA